jgi:hypothetical protein
MEKIALSGPEALRSHVQQKYRNRRYLFRGEDRDWCNTHSSLDRLQASKQIPKDQWANFDQRYLHIVIVLDLVLNARPGFSSAEDAVQYVGPGSLLDEHDQLSPSSLVYAAFQHYGVPSPFLDLTDNLETALFFSSYPRDQKSDVAVVFVIDSEEKQIQKRIARMPSREIYRDSRHARQTAHGLCLRLGSGIRDVDYTIGEDFRLLGGIVEKIIFPWPADARATFHKKREKSLLSVAGDRLATEVYKACSRGLDREAFESIRVDEVFRKVRTSLEDYL